VSVTITTPPGSFLPFVLGSAQLLGHPMIKPKSVLNPDVLDWAGGDFLYVIGVRFIRQVRHRTSSACASSRL
jgi:hypothetical protein